MNKYLLKACAGMEVKMRYHLNGLKKEPVLIYQNPLAEESDMEGFRLEGFAHISFVEGKLRMENAISEEEGQKANYVLWCPVSFPENILIKWKFRPIREPGLAMVFFAASGEGEKDLFDETLTKRTGEYPQYHHGDMNAFHVSYFRRKETEERCFHTCNLRKSYGFHLVAQGADPIPEVKDAGMSYEISLLKYDCKVSFFINELEIFTFIDDGITYGSLLHGGKIGFRQLAPMIGEYSDLMVYQL